MLSPHFSRAEFEHSDTAVARGIPNVMPDGVVAAAAALCLNILEPIRAHFAAPVKLNSGYRCIALNRAIGSKDTSQHTRGEAADIEIPDGPSNADLAAWILAGPIDFDQMILENHHAGQPRSGWVHISYSMSGRQRGQVLTMTMGSHGAVYTQGLRP